MIGEDGVVGVGAGLVREHASCGKAAPSMSAIAIAGAKDHIDTGSLLGLSGAASPGPCPPVAGYTGSAGLVRLN